jgi:hypothetical protein
MRRGGEAMKRQALGATIVFALLLWAVPVAWADSFINYPDGTLSIVQNLGGGIHAHISVDFPGDVDLFTHHVNTFGNLVFLSLEGFTSGLAYWGDFRGTTFSGRLLFDIYVFQGDVGGFFFVGQIQL